MRDNTKWWKYQGDSRYEKVYEKMQLLDIQDITTNRQHKNGTIVWRLPIKNEWGGKLIEVASFKTGYVRNQNSGYSNYQLNKRCESEPQYYEILEWDSKADMNCKRTGKYRKFTTRTCKLIPIEIDRLEYLISYCLKNYYIKRANAVPNGKFVPKWKYDNLADAAKLDYENTLDNETWEFLQDKIRNLESKLETIKEISNV